MKRSAAFLAADRARKRHIPVSRSQRDHMVRLARKAGVETPRVYSMAEATDAITRLEGVLRQPQLEGFGAAVR